MLGLEALRMAVQTLWSRKLRSTMTILGVVIGVASVLAVTSLGAAFEESILSEFDDADNRSVWVYATSVDAGQGPPDAGQFGTIFTDIDRQSILGLEGVESVSATGRLAVTGLSVGDKEIPFESLAATPADGDEVRDIADYHDGGPYMDGASEVVLGWKIAKLLGSDGPVAAGSALTISLPNGNTLNATVAGVLAETDALFGTQNAEVYVPIDPFYTVTRKSPTTQEQVNVFDGFAILAIDARDVDAVRDRVKEFMLADSDAARLLTEGLTIEVSTPSDIQAQISSAFDQITVFIAGIAGVSLVVGGIMIGTIMLISVAERTKEIGMMKAIGALDRDVLGAFLLEAALVGLLGSLLGIALGLALGAMLVAGLFADAELAFIVPWNWVGIAVVVGIGTGVVAGFFPARRAVKIQPVEALSYE